MKSMKGIIEEHPIVAILRNIADNKLENFIMALYQGGIRSFEVSYVTPSASKQIKAMKRILPKDVIVGAGTILDVATAEEALEAESDFLLSPSTDIELLKHCIRNNVAFMPGVFSPSDVNLCLQHGFTTLKLFPAADLPLQYINSLKGPFPKADFVAVGGIDLSNAHTYFSSGFIGVGIGSALADKEDIKNERWDLVAEKIAKSMEILS